tara:strand:- start:563 stop:874 length:312 start_codon:yes stop_codon:yes gene_type:complete
MMLGSIINTIELLLQGFSQTLLPAFIVLYGWYRWGKYWREKIETPFEDIVFESGLKNKDTLIHKLLSIFLPIIGMLICIFGYVIIAYCFSQMVIGLGAYWQSL